MVSIRAQILHDLRLNAVAMLVLTVCLCLYGLVTKTSLFETNFFALWMTAAIDGSISSIVGLILMNIH